MYFIEENDIQRKLHHLLLLAQRLILRKEARSREGSRYMAHDYSNTSSIDCRSSIVASQPSIDQRNVQIPNFEIPNQGVCMQRSANKRVPNSSGICRRLNRSNWAGIDDHRIAFMTTALRHPMPHRAEEFAAENTVLE